MLKAIETRYKGYRFRSRLEARWAVFFDALGIRWEYESEGFDLGEHGFYLPDFFLPQIAGGLWVEIKPIAPTKEEERKLAALTLVSGRKGTFRVGEPMIGVEVAACSIPDAHTDGSSHQDNAAVYEGGDWSDAPYWFCVCPWCLKPGFSFDGRGARVCGYREHYATEDEALDAIKHLGHWRADDKCYTGDHQVVIEAAMAARGARFEHGESGAIA